LATNPGGVQQKVATFFANYPEQRFAKRQIIIQAGEQPVYVFYLLEGRVSQYDISSTGSEVVVNVFKPPAFFSMAWAINRSPNQYFFEAATDVVVRQAPPDDVVAFLHQEPDVLFDLLSRVYRGTDGILRRIAHLIGGDAKSRLVFEIINSAQRFGVENGGGVHIPLKEGDLARHSGMARETVSRVVQQLKKSGLVKVDRNGMSVPSIERLQDELGTNL
jgi:CRP/FNR family transcriptional regulator